MSTKTAPTSHLPSAPALLPLALGAIGVVFGDIGTSPLYALRGCLRAAPDLPAQAVVLGSISLIFWALILVVSVKYLGFIMRADNSGEGGVFALLALMHPAGSKPPLRLTAGAILVLAGAALLYGDGVITPAISVLSAAEGFTDLSAAFTPWVPLIACTILSVLFLIQSQGTHRIGALFGPVMLVWFACIGLLGLWQVWQHPAVLAALNPWYGLSLLGKHPGVALPILGSVVLAITGGEALYADMGHFGRRAIRLGWYTVALPGLLLNYLGQGAYTLSHPADKGHLFFALAPDGLPRLLLILLSIAATFIASQALISGTFSLTRQAIQLGYLPRLLIRHTHAAVQGQIYIPLVNGLLALACLATVIGFGTSDALMGAYGIAVTGTMAVTTVAFAQVCRTRWGWSRWRIGALAGAFLAVDLAFLGANLGKIIDGGWFPLAIGLAAIVLMVTWKLGRAEIARRVYHHPGADIEPGSILSSARVLRVPGSAVFLSASERGTPIALLHHLKANRCLQQTVVLLTILTEDSPTVKEESRLGLEDCGFGVWRAVARSGYMESPDVAELIGRVCACGVPVDPYLTAYYFNREMILTGGPSKMWRWQKSLYAFLSRNARPVRDYYRVPPGQIIELGLPVQL